MQHRQLLAILRHDPVVVSVEGEHAADDDRFLPGHRGERSELPAALQGDRLLVEIAAEDAQAQHGHELVVAQRLGHRSDLDTVGVEDLEHVAGTRGLLIAFPGHAGRWLPLRRWRSVARSC